MRVSSSLMIAFYKDHSQDIVQLDKSAIYDLVLSTPKGGTYQVTPARWH